MCRPLTKFAAGTEDLAARSSGSQDQAHSPYGRVEDGRGSLGPLAIAPFPILAPGISRGGILSIACARMHPREVAGVINFAGGWVADGCRNAGEVNGKLFKRGGMFPHPTLWLAAVPTKTSADDLPNLPVRFVVCFPAGGSTDVAARILVEYVSRSLGQQIYVENRGGANGYIGIEAAAKSTPDGYTLLVCTDATTSNPHIYNMCIDVLKDPVPVLRVSRQPIALAAHAALGVKSLAELVVRDLDRGIRTGGDTACNYDAAGHPRCASACLRRGRSPLLARPRILPSSCARSSGSTSG